MIGFLKTLPLSLKITAPIILVLAVWGALGHAKAAREERLKLREGLRSDSIGAVLDVTRKIDSARIHNLMGDLDVYERRAVQTQNLASDLAKALGTQAQAVASITTTVAGLATKVVGTPTTETAEGVRASSFVVDQPPYRGTAAVELPRPPAPGKLDLKINLDPIPWSYMISCSEPRGNAGIREAQIDISTPPWAPVQIVKAEQKVGVCNPEAAGILRERQKRLGLGVTLGYCATRAADAKVYAGPCIGLGATWRIWP